MSEIQIAVRLPWPMHEKLNMLATATGRSKSAVVRQLIQQAAVTGEPDIKLRSQDGVGVKHE